MAKLRQLKDKYNHTCADAFATDEELTPDFKKAVKYHRSLLRSCRVRDRENVEESQEGIAKSGTSGNQEENTDDKRGGEGGDKPAQDKEQVDKDKLDRIPKWFTNDFRDQLASLQCDYMNSCAEGETI